MEEGETVKERAVIRYLLSILVLAASGLAGDAAPAAKAPAPPPPAPKRHMVVRPWMLPPYLLLGLPRDVLDIPSKGLSSIPLFNKVFFAPLMLLNAITTLTSWSYTEDGSDGSYAAWVACMHLKRQPGKAPVSHVPLYMRYFPNWRTFGTVYWKVRYPEPPKPPAAPKQ